MPSRHRRRGRAGPLRWQPPGCRARRDAAARTLRLAPSRGVRPAGTPRVHRLPVVLGGPAPDDTGEIELTIEKLPRGEVSEFVHDVVEPGDELEVRGPIDGFFVWPGTVRRCWSAADPAWSP